MNRIYALIWALLAMACGADATDYDAPAEFSESRQPLTANCSLGFQYGVQQFTNGYRGRCNIYDATHTCLFPSAGGGGLNFPYNLPFGVGLGVGFTTAERNALNAPMNQATSFIDAALFAGWTPGGPGQPHFAYSTNSSSLFVTINKGTITGGTPSGNLTDFHKLVSFSCTSSQAFTEGFPGSARFCTKWSGNLDYNKVVAWANGDATKLNKIMKNVMKKVFVIGAGNGLRAGSATDLSHDRVMNDSDATVWVNGGEEKGWQSNYVKALLPPNPDPQGATHLNCAP